MTAGVDVRTGTIGFGVARIGVGRGLAVDWEGVPPALKESFSLVPDVDGVSGLDMMESDLVFSRFATLIASVGGCSTTGVGGGR
jgi:hypothetical protein